MVNIAVMGYGVVGSGVVEVIRKKQCQHIKESGSGDSRKKKYWISGIFRTVLNGICLQRILMKF